MTSARIQCDVVSAKTEPERLNKIHQAMDREQLRTEIRESLVEALPFETIAILLDEDDDSMRVEAVSGLDCPFEENSIVVRGAWFPADAWDIALRHQKHQFGRAVVSEPVPKARREWLETLMAHYSTALANIAMREESLSAVDRLCSIQQAFEEGVVLFQIPDAETAAARFLQLAMTVLRAQAGALYVLDRINDCESGLVINQALGVPEEVLQDLVLDTEGNPFWGQDVLETGTSILRRDPETGLFPRLVNDGIAPIMENIVGAPLRYHGVTVGVCVLLNAEDSGGFDEALSSAQHLFELGAAVFHRLDLESKALRSQHLDTQLQIASVIQSRFVPQAPEPTEHLDVAWRSEMSASVGGDYIDFLPGEDGVHLGTVSDVSGHGIDSALVMTSFRAAYRAECVRCSPEVLLTRLNDVVAGEVGDTGMFLTSVALQVAADERSFALSSAGHNPVMLLRRTKDVVEMIESSGPPLGLFCGAGFEREDFEVEPGDILLLYTDGVVEATAPTAPGEEVEEAAMYGEDKLEALLRELADCTADEIVAAVYASVEEFSKQVTQDDDVTVMALKFV